MARSFVLSFLILSTLFSVSPVHAGSGNKKKHNNSSITNQWAQDIGDYNNRTYNTPKKPKSKPQSKSHFESPFSNIKSPTLKFLAFWGTFFATVNFSQAMTCDGNTCVDNPHNLPTTCNPQPRHKDVKTFPPLYHNVPHPGTVTAKTKIKTRKDVSAGLKIIEKNLIDRGLLSTVKTQAEADKLAYPYYQALYKTCEIDAAMGNDDPVDRTTYSQGIKRFEELVLSKGFRNLAPDEFVDSFCQVHHTLTTGEMQGQSKFREVPMIIGTSHTRLFKIDEVMKSLENSQTKTDDIIAYGALVKELVDNNVPSAQLQSRELWQAMAYNILLRNPEHPAYTFLKKHYSVKPTLDAKKVKTVLKETFKKAKKKAETDPIDAAAYLHMRLIDIHGFADGNGRDSRLFAAGLLSDYGFTPPVILHNKKYTAAIQKAYEKTNHSYFAEYLREAICETEEKFDSPEARKNWSFFLEDLSRCEAGDCENVCSAHLNILGISRDLGHLVDQ